MTPKFAVVQYQTNPLTTQHDHADLEDGTALGGIEIAAPVIE
ncbi:hypothetical protein [Hymenobacter sp. UV11]|nr:hypothetical protein [Hymenobacter sp. UV11]